MNFSNYPKPSHASEILFIRQDSICGGITWRGYLTRATLLAIGFGSYILLKNNKIDFGENGKRFFYAIREYFPRGKDDADHHVVENKNNKYLRSLATGLCNEDKMVFPVSLVNSKTGLIIQISENRASNLLILNPEIITEKTEYKNQNLTQENRICELSVKEECSEVYDDGIRTDDESNNTISRTKNYLLNYSNYLRNQKNHKKKNYLIISTFVIIVIAAMMTNKFESLSASRFKFIGYSSIFNYLIPLIIIVMPTIYISGLFIRDNLISYT